MNLWMRWVDFRKLRDLLLLVAEHPRSLRPSDLDRLGLERQVLVTTHGKPLGPTSRYHHRRTLERLGLIYKTDGKYTPNGLLPELGILTRESLVGNPLSADEQSAFANLVVRDRDCYAGFFAVFAGQKEPPSSVEDFIEKARPVHIHIVVDHGPVVRLVQSETGRENTLRGHNALQAIHFGLRAWCVE